MGSFLASFLSWGVLSSKLVDNWGPGALGLSMQFFLHEVRSEEASAAKSPKL